MKKHTIINYGGTSRELKITTGVLFRFEDSGYTLADFENPDKQIRAHVALIGAALDPDAALALVADRCPPFQQISAAIVSALDDREVTLEPDKETPQGKECAAGGSSVPLPASNSASSRKSLKAPHP